MLPTQIAATFNVEASSQEDTLENALMTCLNMISGIKINAADTKLEVV